MPVVTEAESWISDATWALAASMVRNRVRGRRENIIMFRRGDAGDEGKRKR